MATSNFAREARRIGWRIFKSTSVKVFQLTTTALFLAFPLVVEWDREQAMVAAEQSNRDLLSGAPSATGL